LLQESHLAGFLLAWRIFDPDGVGRIPLCQFRYLCVVSMLKQPYNTNSFHITTGCTSFGSAASNELQTSKFRVIFLLQELRRSHNALGMMSRFTFALLRAELAAVDGDVICFLLQITDVLKNFTLMQ
jgi:hypothetical protein